MGETGAVTGAVERGREAFRRQAWGEAGATLHAADREVPLGLDDLERLAVALYLVGDDEASAEAMPLTGRSTTPRAGPLRPGCAGAAGVSAAGLSSAIAFNNASNS